MIIFAFEFIVYRIHRKRPQEGPYFLYENFFTFWPATLIGKPLSAKLQAWENALPREASISYGGMVASKVISALGVIVVAFL